MGAGCKRISEASRKRIKDIGGAGFAERCIGRNFSSGRAADALDDLEVIWQAANKRANFNACDMRQWRWPRCETVYQLANSRTGACYSNKHALGVI